MSERKPELLLEDILEAANKILKYVKIILMNSYK
jgi:uncharacterized protein with HEPN domain